MTTFAICLIIIFYVCISTISVGRYFSPEKTIGVILIILFGWIVFPMVLGDFLGNLFKKYIDND